jgi:hypothetical protein
LLSSALSGIFPGGVVTAMLIGIVTVLFSALKDWIQYFSANSVKMSNWGDQYTLSVYILHIRNEGGQYFHCSQLEKFIQIRLGHNPMNAIK